MKQQRTSSSSLISFTSRTQSLEGWQFVHMPCLVLPGTLTLLLSCLVQRYIDSSQLAEEHGFTIDEAIKKGWIENLQNLPLIKFQMFVEAGKIDVDIFLTETDFLKQLLDRRSLHNDGTWSAYFISPEDLILMKLMANRLKDQVDVEDIFFMQGQLDESYMRSWAKKLNVLPLLEQALAKQKAK